MDKLASALSALQGELENVAKEKNNPHFKSKYADLASVWDTIRGPLAKNGLAIVQLPCEAPLGQVGLRTIILHTSGETLEDRFFMPLRKADDPQAAGSAITYARRYSLMGAVGIAPEDDDGNGAAAKVPGPTHNELAVFAGLIDEFKKSFEAGHAAGDQAGMKDLFLKLRNLNAPEGEEHTKAALLTKMTAAFKWPKPATPEPVKQTVKAETVKSETMKSEIVKAGK